MAASLRGIALVSMIGLAACSTGGRSALKDGVYAPGFDPRGEAVDGLLVGHRLMEAQQYELALEAFQRAAAREGLTSEIMTAMGTANIGLGRLNQAERLLRRAIKQEAEWPEAWNNLGVVLMELDRTAEAAEIFHKAFALDNGQNDSIRDNLRLALAKTENSGYAPEEEQEYKLVRRGSSDYLISRVP